MELQTYYNYWDNRYKVGEIQFIKKSSHNPQRKFFVDWVCRCEDIKSILEVGPGEMIEYKMIHKRRPDVNYSIADVSKIFIENCRKKHPEVDTYRISLEELDILKDKNFDCVYQSAVFEHSPDVRAAIKNCISIGKQFHFVFFKWRWKDGGLKSQFFKGKNFYSSSFNIWKIIEEIEKYGSIDYADVISKNGNIPIEQLFRKRKGKKQRDGRWLAIHGSRK